jgi:hypothetical protein
MNNEYHRTRGFSLPILTRPHAWVVAAMRGRYGPPDAQAVLLLSIWRTVGLIITLHANESGCLIYRFFYGLGHLFVSGAKRSLLFCRAP